MLHRKTSLARTVSKIRFATVVLPDPVPPEIPMIKLTKLFSSSTDFKSVPSLHT
jgi:hypothetical protein